MEPGLFGQKLTLMEELKATTFAAHTRLQAAPIFEALASCQLPLESYVGQLRALSVIHGVLEQALADCADERVKSVWSSDMSKLPLLQKDFQYFEPRTVSDIREAVEASLKVAEHVRLISLEQPLSLLGCLYVLEGSTLGARVLGPLVARAFLLAGAEGLAYLHSYGSEVRARWAHFQRRMNGLRVAEQEREQMNAAANDFFGQLEVVFLALYPFQPESRTFSATSINPEAGRHPMPADVREVQASLRAGDICWERFPYFEQRYGERGRRFARSDAAWQATLYRYEPAQILQQVRWLGRVLASRGMPTLLLQVQLEILVAELAAAIPENKPEYEKLLAAAAELHAGRNRYLGDDQINAIASQFDQAVGDKCGVLLPGTGTLLACAVADESAGNVGAIESLRSWMTDSTRFPAEWTVAVEATLAQARQQVQSAGARQPKSPMPCETKTVRPAIAEATYKHYLAALLVGNRVRCAEVVKDLVGKNVDLKDLYVNLFQRSMYQVGELWERQRISVAVEHLATAITERLLSIVQAEVFKGQKRGQSIVVACVADDPHQLGGRIVADFCELRGWRGHFLGADRSLQDLLQTIKERRPTLLGLSLSIVFHQPALLTALDAVTHDYPELPILVGGQALHWGGIAALQRYPTVSYIASLDDLEQRLQAYEH
jgi:methanogenic corrinoid protein MtbC1/heme oxygenase